jgi:hypothetical protein
VLALGINPLVEKHFLATVCRFRNTVPTFTYTALHDMENKLPVTLDQRDGVQRLRLKE